MGRTVRPGTRRSTASTAGMTPKAFWWQWPWRWAVRPAASGKAMLVRPAARSSARTSSTRYAAAATGAASSRGRSAATSSRKVSRQDGLEADDAGAASDEGGERGERAAGLGAGLLDAAGGEEGPAAAERPAGGAGVVEAVAGGGEHPLGGGEVPRLEVAVEGVGEEHEVAAVAGHVSGGGFGGAPRRLPDRERPGGGEAEQAFAEARQPGQPIAQVHEAAEPRRVGGVAGEPGDQPLAQRQAVAAVVVVQELGLHPRHVDAGRAFVAAGLAADAERHGRRHVGRGEGVRAELAGERQPEAVGAAPGQVLLVAGDAVARAHRAAGELAAGAVAVAHLDGAGEAAPVRPVERRGGPLGGGRVGGEAEERGVVHRERADDLAGVQAARGVEGVLDRLEGAHEAGAEHALVELRARDAVAVLAGVRALEAADELEGLLGDGAHRPASGRLAQVEDRAHVQAADRGVGVPGAAGAVAGEEIGDRLGVVGEVVERHGAVLDEADRLGVALGRHHDVEAGLAHLPDGALSRRVGHLDDGMGEAVVGHAGVEASELRREGVAGSRRRTRRGAGSRACRG